MNNLTNLIKLLKEAPERFFPPRQRKWILASSFLIGALLCLSSSSLLAGPATTSVYLEFTNTGCQTVKVYWQNGSQHSYYYTLNAGESYTQHSYDGHVWVFKLNDGTYIGSYTANHNYNQSHDVHSGGCDNGDVDCSSVPDYISGFIYLGQFGDSKYFCSSTNNFEWDEAVASAAANGGTLAVINSAAENDFLADHILATAWIGYTDEANEGTFVWVNGDPTTYTKWSSGEPNNQGINGGSADYTVMTPGNGKWKDRNGHDHYEFIMEIPCPEVCTGEITGLIFDALDGGSDVTITDGATYATSDLPSSFRIQALVAGDHESLEFVISGDLNQSQTENLEPYTIPGGSSNALDLPAGSYTVHATLYSEDHLEGEICGEVSLSFTIEDTPDCPTTFFNGGLIEANDAECRIESINPPEFNGQPLEIVWIKSPNSQDCAGALNELGPINVGAAYDAFLAAGGPGVADAQIGNTSWMFAFDGDSDDLTFDASDISEPTCFFRCVRPVGCERFFGEAGPVTISCPDPCPTTFFNGGLIEANEAECKIESINPPDFNGQPLEIVWIKSPNSTDCNVTINELGPINVGAAYDAFLAAGGFGVADPTIGGTSWMFASDGDSDDLTFDASDITVPSCFFRCVRPVGCERFFGEAGPVTISCTPPGPDCPAVPDDIPGFIYLGEFDDSKYYCSSTNNFEWDEAVAATEANGGFLAVINSAAENDFLAEHILATAWIGYTDEDSEGTFVWVNGDPTTYTNWSSGEPNNQGVNGGTADYTVIIPNNGKWKDRNGHDHYEFIMEIPCPTTPAPPVECDEELLAYWSLDDCFSQSGNGSASDYSELVPDQVNTANCLAVNATNLFRVSGNHSCTPSPSGLGVCVASQDVCNANNLNDDKAFRIDVTINPEISGAITELSFLNAAPESYDWGGNAQGPSNFPTLYAIKVLKDGATIFEQTDIPTSREFTLQTFDFSSISAFTTSGESTFTFLVSGYCRIGNGASASVFEIDEIRVKGGCCDETPTCPNPNAGTLTLDPLPQCIDGCITASATPNGDKFIPTGYAEIYVLTSGAGLVIQQVNSAPVFTVCEEGTYTIHTLVYDPATLDLSIVVPGVTTGFDVNSLLIQGGGDICASLDVAGAPFEAPNEDDCIDCEDYFDGGMTTAGVCEDGTVVISSDAAPDADGVPFEIVWIKSTLGSCDAALLELGPVNVGAIYDAFVAAGGFGNADANIPGTSWMFVTDGDDDDLSLTVTGLTEAACFMRCARIIGCERFLGEGNLVPIDCTSGPSTEPVTYDACDNNISVSGVSNGTWYFLKVYSADYSSTVFECNSFAGGCAEPTLINLPDGDYVLDVILLDEAWMMDYRLTAPISLPQSCVAPLVDNGSTGNTVQDARSESVPTPTILDTEVPRDLVSEIATNEDLIVFPNPAINEVSFLSSKLAGKTVELQILNNLGQVIATQTWNVFADGPVTWDVSTYQPGLYYARFIQNNGEENMVKRFIVSSKK